jgi:hypothetical protein
VILVPILERPGLSETIRDHFLQQLDELDIDMDVFKSSRPFHKEYPSENFFGRLARMRQWTVDTALRDYHTDVLWIDHDIVEFPKDLYQRLRKTEGVVAPIVLIEGTKDNYDTAGMREVAEHRSAVEPPWFAAPGPVVDVQSVGGCVLVPAAVHRKVKFASQPDSDENWLTEWWALCQGAIQEGFKVSCDTSVEVYHAHLPSYGENWH